MKESESLLFFLATLIPATVNSLPRPHSSEGNPSYMIKGPFLVSGYLVGWAEFPIESGLQGVFHPESSKPPTDINLLITSCSVKLRASQ